MSKESFPFTETNSNPHFSPEQLSVIRQQRDLLSQEWRVRSIPGKVKQSELAEFYLFLHILTSDLDLTQIERNSLETMLVQVANRIVFAGLIAVAYETITYQNNYRLSEELLPGESLSKKMDELYGITKSKSSISSSFKNDPELDFVANFLNTITETGGKNEFDERNKIAILLIAQRRCLYIFHWQPLINLLFDFIQNHQCSKPSLSKLTIIIEKIISSMHTTGRSLQHLVDDYLGACEVLLIKSVAKHEAVAMLWGKISRNARQVLLDMGLNLHSQPKLLVEELVITLQNQMIEDGVHNYAHLIVPLLFIIEDKGVWLSVLNNLLSSSISHHLPWEINNLEDLQNIIFYLKSKPVKLIPKLTQKRRREGKRW